MEDLSSWIGRGVAREDVVTERLLAEYRATLSPYLFIDADDACPPGFHWGLAPALPFMADLDGDGSEAKGLFLPPIAMPRRMWAGGAVETFAGIRIGMTVKRIATISSLKMREGKSGPLCFVLIVHELRCGPELLLRERQDLVFREGKKSPAPTAPEPSAFVKNALEWRLDASPALLFRFSAFTFNAHRVHYDLPYATETEAYGGLLVHGPLQATLLLNQAAIVIGHVPSRFEYRCVAPLIGGSGIIVATARDGTGRIVDRHGFLACEATAVR